MIKLTSLLADGYKRISPLKLSAIKRYIDKNCQEALSAINRGVEIYRADDLYQSDEPTLIKTAKTPRYTANGDSNHYMLYTNESPHWKKFPRRNYSTICGGYNEASNFGWAYLLLFVGNPNIGISAHHDFWSSSTIRGGELDYFKDELGELFNDVGMMDIKSMNINPEVYNKKLNELRQIYDTDPSQLGLNDFGEWLGQQQHFKREFYEAFYSYFTPKTAKAKVVTLSSCKKSPQGHELWSEGSCVAIHPDSFENIFGIKLKDRRRE